MKPKLVVGLTGGIASGKTAASRCFERLGVPVIDADVVARDVVERGQPGLDAVVKNFGREVLDEGGRLDRKRLRDMVFDDPARREALESILHPRIRERMRELLEQVDHDYAVLEIPLLLEARQTDMVDRILVVDVPESVQIARASKRDGVPEKDIREIMAAQISREERLARADDVIDNQVSLEELCSRVGKLDRFYRAIAHGVAGRGR